MNAHKSQNSLKGLKNTQVLTGAAILTAMHVVLNQFTIPVSPTLHIGISFLPFALAGWLYGPAVGAAVGGIGDILAFFIRPNGLFFPGFTLNSALTGLIFGLFLYQKRLSLKNVMLAVLVQNSIVSMVLTPLWLYMMYETPLFVYARFLKTIILYPINVFLLYTTMKLLYRRFALKLKK